MQDGLDIAEQLARFFVHLPDLLALEVSRRTVAFKFHPDVLSLPIRLAQVQRCRRIRGPENIGFEAGTLPKVPVQHGIVRQQ